MQGIYIFNLGFNQKKDNCIRIPARASLKVVHIFRGIKPFFDQNLLEKRRQRL